jgi:probable F420-dependent oxidoreductase
MPKPFRFMARMPQLTGSGQEFKDAVEKIEDLGYSSVACPDHWTGGSVNEPFAAMMAAALCTTRLRVCSIVAGNDYRHPVVLHKAAAMIDVLSDGRLELGMGAGWMMTDYETAGMTYDRPGIRVSRLEESVKIVKGLFGGEPFSFDGEHYKITALDGLPKPVQEPHPPILIGGGGRRVLSIAAREADIISINPNLKAGAVGPEAAQDASAERTDQKVSWIHDAAKKAGRPMDDLELQMGIYMCQVTTSADEADTMRQNLSGMFGVEPAQVGESPAVLIGSLEECVDKLQERRERWGVNYVDLGGDFATTSAIVSRLNGK